MDKFWDAIDLGENLGRCIRVVKRYSGLQAGIMAIFTFLIAVVTFSLAWTFDILSTIEATSGLATEVQGNLPYRFVQYAPLVIFAITFAPTLMELGGAAFARGGATPFQWLVIGLSIFDLLTDAPATTAFLARADWSQWGMFEWPAYMVAWVVWLGMSSFFFEMVCVCAAVATFALVLRTTMGQKKAQPAVVYES